MRPSFPGTDPWLERPSLWPDVHNRLIAAIADAMSPVVTPKYYIGLEPRVSLISGDELGLIGVPDLVVATSARDETRHEHPPRFQAGLREIELLIEEEVRETFLKIRNVSSGKVVTIIEVLSPINKQSRQGRAKYLAKRRRIFDSLTSLVEIDLLRAGPPMPMGHDGGLSDYRILVSRGRRRPKADLYSFGVRDPIPTVPLPLLPGDAEPPMELWAILHAIQDRAWYDLMISYDQPPDPPLNEADEVWAKGFRQSSRGRKTSVDLAAPA